MPLATPGCDLGALDETRSVRRWETFLNGPDSSTFGGCCNQSFTQLFFSGLSCTIAGETRRKGVTRVTTKSSHAHTKSGHAHIFGALVARPLRGVRGRLGPARFRPQDSLRWIPGPICGTLEPCRQGADSQQKTGTHFHAQAHISTQSPQARENPRFPRAHED